MGLFVKKTEIGDSQPLYRIGGEKTILIIGLGNPGPDYDGTRHNIGFECIDAFADKHDFGWINKKDLRCQLAYGNIGATRVLLAKPTTFMNESGQAANALQRFYRVYNSDTYVIHDDIDVELGSIRTRLGGGSAGHNGIKSLIQHIGDDFGRIRVGIGPKHPEQIDSADFVLAKFSKKEQAKLAKLIIRTIEVTEEIINSSHLKEQTLTS